MQFNKLNTFMVSASFFQTKFNTDHLIRFIAYGLLINLNKKMLRVMFLNYINRNSSFTPVGFK